VVLAVGGGAVPLLGGEDALGLVVLVQAAASAAMVTARATRVARFIRTS
jgi:hypothetical protein